MANDDFFDFSKDILSDLAKEGYSGDKLQEVKHRQDRLNKAMNRVIEDAERTAVPLTKTKLEKAIGLR
ncbi:hypothetical protein [Limosilactobacillus mucosae]|uniref:hypothetical protein n=1 Tax=Limosilactobacillus mucosae TaxID=97478 RepID=UPI0022E07C2E|nr:hypothetical protein [Limosilactobacillus mucosae]